MPPCCHCRQHTMMKLKATFTLKRSYNVKTLTVLNIQSYNIIILLDFKYWPPILSSSAPATIPWQLSTTIIRQPALAFDKVKICDRESSLRSLVEKQTWTTWKLLYTCCCSCGRCIPGCCCSLPVFASLCCRC